MLVKKSSDEIQPQHEGLQLQRLVQLLGLVSP